MTLQSRIIARVVKINLEKDAMSVIAIMNKIASPRKIARRLLPEIKKDLGYNPKLGTVAKAVERYVNNVKKTGKLAGYDTNALKAIMAKTRVNLQSDIVVLAVNITENIEKKLVEIVQYVHSRKEKPFLNITYGHSYITIITDQSNFKKILKIIGKKNIVYCRKNQAGLSIFTPEGVLDVPGQGGYIFSLLGLNGINIVETLSSYNEGILILSEKDAHSGYSLLRAEIDRLRKQLKM